MAVFLSSRSRSLDFADVVRGAMGLDMGGNVAASSSRRAARDGFQAEVSRFSVDLF
jgi:hypothetical protein